ncbi:multicopper oxidase domain-containing protein [Streptomyces sp. Qhu-G9]|uniref:multicopper oxidase family protein n=1 Tax=Streptomyces sp. Qhu-G9 TaxID=3452799 RepID=UPI0022ABD368|nr:multicopper oxidase domain-containing protein [Streptomyces aurantiacus]WAU82265.1 multicopper oxidase domain-containing protein [Streptomyces aurantiacus]WAU82403.1 multicopper oxidase domain-containing protein [Streptomyces aurantiacus]
MRRRTLLGAGGAMLGAGALTAAGWPALSRYAREGRPGTVLPSQTELPAPFRTPLPIPRVLAPTSTSGTTDHYDITQQHTELEILPGLRTPAWTYAGTFPGPTIVSRSGRRTVVRHRNELDRPAVVHLHGGHTPAASDGYPTSLILPADGSYDAHRVHQDMNGGPHGSSMGHHPMDLTEGTRTYTYPLDQRAATLWYHDHRMSYTGTAVWMGLAGFHLIHDDEEEQLELPRGDRDIPLMITDRSFAADGSFRYPALDPQLHTPGVTDTYMNGVLGDVILVNGAPWPVHHTQRLRYRLRLLNASNARLYTLQLDPQPPGGGGLLQIGSDGGLLNTPRPHDTLDIAPGERFDIIIDFSRYRPGTQVRLLNRNADGPTAQIMRFDTGSGSPHDDTRVPHRLSDIPRLDPSRATITRDFHFRGSTTGWTINGKEYKPGHTLARPQLGQIEIWRFTTNFHHPIHLHLNHFQVLTRNNHTPGTFDHGWKDTINLHPAEAVEITTHFTHYPGTYMIHCHNLEHEDMAMMADFTTH